MKLGDSMAPLEACSVWNDVCPRKTRPPKIGDIPRHVAVDEESPGCTTSRSLGQFQEAKSSTGSMLERSTSCQSEHGKPKGTVATSTIKIFHNCTEATRNNETSSRIPNELASTFQRSYNPKDSIVLDEKSLNGTLPIIEKVSTISSDKTRELEILRENPSVQVLRTESEVSWEDEIPERIFQVRKDSALYLDESNPDSSNLRESLFAAGADRTVPVSCPSSLRESIEEARRNSRLTGPRARRESSGYFSNLGTFDEDRWSTNPMDHPSQLDTNTLRERRRSSTKNRLPASNHQQQSQSTICLTNVQQFAKMTNLICPTSIDQESQQYSSNNEVTTTTKMGRLEMPNIDEQTSLDLDKPINYELVESARRCDHTGGNDDELCAKLSQVSLGHSPRTEDVTARSNDSSSGDERTNEAIGYDGVETKESTIQLCNADSGNQWSARTAGRQRRRMVVHQYSSPNITNTELERIVEKPHGERLHGTNVESKSDVDRNAKVDKSESVDEEEDDNDEVVVAKLDMPDKRREDEVDPTKLLPKSVKVYQLLSTQSEDRGDGETRFFDRRISLQITRHEDETIRNTDNSGVPPVVRGPVCFDQGAEKKLFHADSVPILKIPRSEVTRAENECRAEDDNSERLRKLSSSGDTYLCVGEQFNAVDNVSRGTIAGIRPIYPYCPYSPYASPQGSPRTNRRRPLRESRRVSIDSRQGALQLNQYKLLKNIGQGSYGIVKLAYNEEDETHYAMKILSKKKLMKKAGIFGRIGPGRKGVSNPLAKVYREIALLKKLDHPNVVKLVEVLDDPDEDNLYLVFELVQKGEVLQLPTDKPLDEETARRHFRDVVMGVEYLHYQRIVHRDIKPSNLLVDSEGRVKVADLGVSAELRATGELLSGSAGTPAFAAPETTTPGAQYSGTLCDVWSMGVTLYSLVIGKVPWDGAGSIIGVQAAVRSEQLRFPENSCISEILRELISRMLSKDPLRRITLAEIKEHSWVTNDGKELLPNEADNCRLPVTVTDEEVARVVTRVPKLDTLILIKTMLKQHSFQNPFLPKRIVRSVGDTGTSGAVLKQQTSSDMTDSSKESLPTDETLASKTEQFHKAGRSNSAPDSYEWQTNGRQISSDSLLPPLKEFSCQEAELEKR